MAAPSRILPFTVLLVCGEILPLVLALFWQGRGRAFILAALAASFVPRIISVWKYRQPLMSALLHPVGVFVLLAIQWYTLTLKLAGLQVTWKERAYPVG